MEGGNLNDFSDGAAVDIIPSVAQPLFYPGIYQRYASLKVAQSMSNDALYQVMMRDLVIPPPSLIHAYQDNIKEAIAHPDASFGLDQESGVMTAVTVKLLDMSAEDAVREAEWQAEIGRQAPQQQKIREEQAAKSLSRWQERRAQLVMFYKLNYPETGPDFENFVTVLLQNYTFEQIIAQVLKRDPNAVLPRQWSSDLERGYELGYASPPPPLDSYGI